MNRYNTLIIIGDSPYLKEVGDRVQHVANKYTSIGINSIIQKCNVTEHLFVDSSLLKITNKYPSTKTVSLYRYGDLIQKENKELYNTFTFDLNSDTKQDIIKNKELAWCGFSHDFAISYAILKGWKNVVLLGAADFWGENHYSTEYPFNYSDVLKAQSKEFIENFCSKRVNLFTCNPESLLEIPRVNIDNLLK